MARKGIDFSGARPSPRTLQANGIECALFYVGAPGDWRMPPRTLIEALTCTPGGHAHAHYREAG